MAKKFWFTFLVTFLLLWFLQFVLHALLLSGFYSAHPEGLLSEEMMMQRSLWLPVGFLIWAFLWTYFFHRFTSKKSLGKGLQHGAAYMLFLFLPSAFINYATLPVNGYCYLWWLLGNLVIGLIIGAVMGVIMKGEEAKA